MICMKLDTCGTVTYSYSATKTYRVKIITVCVLQAFIKLLVNRHVEHFAGRYIKILIMQNINEFGLCRRCLYLLAL